MNYFLNESESLCAAVPGLQGHRKVDFVERNVSVALKAAPLTTENGSEILEYQLAEAEVRDLRAQSAVSLRRAHPRTLPYRALWRYRKVDLVERNAPVFLAAAMTTVPNFDSSRDAVWGWGKVRAQCFSPSHLTPGTPGSNENPPPHRCG